MQQIAYLLSQGLSLLLTVITRYIVTIQDNRKNMEIKIIDSVEYSRCVHMICSTVYYNK